jgi:uncharacterized membrane protein
MSTGSADPSGLPLVPFHARRVVRFFLSAACGLVAGAVALMLPLGGISRMLLALDVFFAAYLVQMLRLSGMNARSLRAHTAEDDEGALLISLLGALAFAASLGAIISVLAHPDGGLVEAVLGLLAVPLGWGMVHSLAAHHYAFLYYDGLHGPGVDPKGGLEFPGHAEPASIDFLYFSYCVGMAAQVSDVVVTTPEMRRVVMVHAICSFFANAVILALAVNAAAALHF